MPETFNVKLIFYKWFWVPLYIRWPCIASKNDIVHIVLQNTFASVKVGYGQVRDCFGGIRRFKCGLRWKGWVNSVIIQKKIHVDILGKYKYM